MIAAEFEALLGSARTATLSPGSASALGIASIDLRREADALPAVVASAQAHRSDPAPWHVVGLMHRALDDLSAAIAALDNALAIGSPGPILLHARAHAAREAGLTSIEWYRRARAAAPEDSDVILGEAAALAAEGEADAADRLLLAVLNAHPGWFAGHTALIRLRHARRHPARFGAIDAAITRFPADWRLHHLKTIALLRAEEGERARAALSYAYQNCGEIAPLQAVDAMIATEFDSIAEARAAFARCNIDSDADLTVSYLRHLVRCGEPERIVERYANDLDSVPAVVWPYLSIAWRMTGDARALWLDDPRLVREIDLGPADMLAPLAATLRRLHERRGPPIDQSVRGGSQTDGPLFSMVDPAIRAIRAKCLRAVAGYIDDLPAHDRFHPLLGHVPHRPRFVGSWSVRLTNGGHHIPHVHTEGWLSSVVYIALPNLPDTVDNGTLALGEPQQSLNAGLPPHLTVRPSLGRGVLFPSILWHGTQPFATGERLTIAFDVG